MHITAMSALSVLSMCKQVPAAYIWALCHNLVRLEEACSMAPVCAQIGWS